MRIDRLIIIPLLILAACKATPPPSSGSYSEDLSIHRPSMEATIAKGDNEQQVINKPYIPLAGHIRYQLDSISRFASEQNKVGKYVDGFVIQLYSGNNRELANQTRAKMNSYFPELEPKVSYHQPNFRVKAGKFTDRLKANRIHQLVKEEFPKAILIPDRFIQKYE